MALSPRKEKILKAVVDKYISDAVPVSSKEIQVSHMQDTSSATIRNELAALEEMGYLTQPHTSSGRVPTAEAYRLYVEKLMPKRKLTTSELAIIKKNFSTQVTEIEEILKKTAKVISEVTNYTSVAFAPKINDAVIKNIKFIKLTDYSALTVIVTDMGVVRDTVIELEEPFSEDYFEAASIFTLKAFYNKRVSEIVKPKKAIAASVGEYKAFFDYVIRVLEEYYLSEDSEEDILIEGTSKILEYPEYSNVEKARAVLKVLDAKEKLYPLLKNSEQIDLNIQIGHEGDDPLNDCAIITTNYQVNGKSIANAGVIGPIRMDYPLVISVLDYIGKTLQALPGSAGDKAAREKAKGKAERKTNNEQ